jgi:hypothetical protein
MTTTLNFNYTKITHVAFHCMLLVTTMATGNNIIIRFAIFDHSFDVASRIASIHLSLYHKFATT